MHSSIAALNERINITKYAYKRLNIRLCIAQMPKLNGIRCIYGVYILEQIY